MKTPRCSSSVKLQRTKLFFGLITIFLGIMISSTATAHSSTKPIFVGALPTIEIVPAFSIDTLIERLKSTKAIGLFTKLALKDDVEDLMENIRKADPKSDLSKSRSEFDGLVLKTLTLLDDKDPTLAEDIYVARDQIWQSIIEDKT